MKLALKEHATQIWYHFLVVLNEVRLNYELHDFETWKAKFIIFWCDKHRLDNEIKTKQNNIHKNDS